jgi:hypothetical protein
MIQKFIDTKNIVQKVIDMNINRKAILINAINHTEVYWHQ